MDFRHRSAKAPTFLATENRSLAAAEFRSPESGARACTKQSLPCMVAALPRTERGLPCPSGDSRVRSAALLVIIRSIRKATSRAP